MLLSERGLGGNDADLELRLRRWRGEKGKRAEAARGLARRWLALLARRAHEREPRQRLAVGRGERIGACVALAFPDRVSKRRDASRRPTGSASAGAASGSIRPRRSRARNGSPSPRSAASRPARASSPPPPIDQATVEALFADRIETGAELAFDPATGTVRASHGRRLGAIRLSGGQDSRADPAAIEAALLEGVRAHGLDLLPWSEAAPVAAHPRRLRPRATIRRSPISPTRRCAALDDWLPPLLAGKRRLGEVDPGALTGLLDALLGWEGRKARRPARARPFRDPRRQPPRDRL